MRFKKIELIGFKSFADKTIFDFSSGITAILGPNGCGKSNIVDAVKWVLGEQKAKSLRGGEMADVIFSGSERRKPMGMAEVSLYFDNEDNLLPVDFNEVCITRRLYRSGESEYLINKQRCRLRDIKDLFMDTGVGTSAYSFIEQGKVEALLAAKPHERRVVFEEAAGISKYKARRKETLSRLERTEQYLLRVNDIVEEVDKRIRSVSRQAQSARRYQRLSEELRDARGRLYVCKWNKENEKSSDISTKLAELSQLKGREEIQSGNIGHELTDLQKSEMDIEEKLSEHEKSLMALQQEVTKSESEKARVQERVISLEKESASLLEQADNLSHRITALEKEKEELLATRTELDSATTQLAESISITTKKHDYLAEYINQSEHRIESAREELSQVRSQKGEISSNKARFDSEAETLQARKSSVAERIETLNRKDSALKAEQDELNASSSRLAENENRIQEGLKVDKDQVEILRKGGENAAAEISKLENTKSAKESRHATLLELENSMAGFFRGVRSAVEAWKNGTTECSDIEGVVADLFNVNQEYAVAIETALGSSQQNIITNTAHGAKQAISYLKHNQLGRATFLPLNKIKPRDAADSFIKGKPGVIGEAIDLVAYDSRYKSAAEYLLNGIIVIEDLDQALKLREEGISYRMVTLDGDVINPAGAMTGGRENSQKAGLITRKSEMEELKTELSVLDRQLTSALSERDRVIAELLQLNNQIRENETALEQISSQVREAQNLLSGKTAELASLSEEISGISGEVSTINTRLEEIEQQSISLREQEQEKSRKEFELQEIIEKSAPELTGRKQEAEASAAELTKIKIAYAEKVQKLHDVNERLTNLDSDTRDRREESERCLSRAENSRSEKSQLEAKSVELEEQVAGWLSKRNSSEIIYNELRQNLGNLRAALEEKRTEERATNKRITDIAESISNLKIEERECALKLEAVQEKVREELELSSITELIEMLDNEEDEIAEEYVNEISDNENPQKSEDQLEQQELIEPVFTEGELEEKVAELQDKIRRIGPVNHKAIEELSELKARSEFLSSEKDDLDLAREDLESLIDRLNNECRKKFDDTFYKVKENFQLLFKRLFGGGKADLILEDNEDPLDAGIEIVARPPGKEPKSISLLSGGEKALCAVALLFAIFRSKPSPFCILDEVDGPLDESNIDRYMDAVREFSLDSQFIIITHSKRTMSMTDIIYGVTQSEPGISKKMSLKFEEENEAQLEEANTGVA
ncbi:MAG: chromosome segregation protein SMC [Planctomycetota bacterium]|jgi:chromosome segregation protein